MLLFPTLLLPCKPSIITANEYNTKSINDWFLVQEEDVVTPVSLVDTSPSTGSGTLIDMLYLR